MAAAIASESADRGSARFVIDQFLILPRRIPWVTRSAAWLTSSAVRILRGKSMGTDCPRRAGLIWSGKSSSPLNRLDWPCNTLAH